MWGMSNNEKDNPGSSSIVVLTENDIGKVVIQVAFTTQASIKDPLPTH